MKNINLLLFTQLFFGNLILSQSIQLDYQTTIRLEKSNTAYKINDLRFNDEKGDLFIQLSSGDSIKQKLHSFSLDQSLNIIGETDTTLSAQATKTNKRLAANTEETNIEIHQNLLGEIFAYKRKGNLPEENPYPREEKEGEVVQVKGKKEEILLLYQHFYNSASKATYLIVGFAEKEVNYDYQIYRNFQIIRVTNDLKVEYLETIEFKSNMAIHYYQILSYEEDPDLSDGLLALAFSPAKFSFNKKNESYYPRDQWLFFINQEGEIVMDLYYKTRISGWSIENFTFSPDGESIYFFGPAKKRAYINELIPTSTTLWTELYNSNSSRWKYFQVLKITDNKLDWINAVPLEEFDRKLETPPSSKKVIPYRGKDFYTHFAFVTPTEELFIGGQNTAVGIGPYVENEYKDLILFHFDQIGNLKRQYATNREVKNKNVRKLPVLQDLVLNPNDSIVYWIQRDLFQLKNYSSSQKAIYEMLPYLKNFYNLSVSALNIKSGQMEDFKKIGFSSKGEQKYFAHPQVPFWITPDNRHLLFINVDQVKDTWWIGKMKF